MKKLLCLLALLLPLGSAIAQSVEILPGNTSSGNIVSNSGTNPTLLMFKSGIANPLKTIIGHTPGTYSDWGLQYQDVGDKFRFSQGTDNIMVIDMLNKRVGVGLNTMGTTFEVATPSGNNGINISKLGNGFGSGRLSMWSDRETVNEWRPGYIESGDNGSFTGRLDFFTNGTGAANKIGSELGMSVVNGSVGIGYNNPTEKLNIRDGNIVMETGAVKKVLIRANGAFSAGDMTLYASNGNKTLEVKGSDALNKAGEIKMYDPTTNSLTMELDGDWGGTGKSRIVVDELQITGGADFAEYFNVIGNVIPEEGTVLSVSDNGSADLTISNKPYDVNIVGVLSGANGVNPGIMLKQKDSKVANGDYPVAISGRVYVKAESSRNAIKPGDLLTSSNVAGYAMKATQKRKFSGAIVGKALTGLEKNEKGYVLVLLGVK